MKTVVIRNPRAVEIYATVLFAPRYLLAPIRFYKKHEFALVLGLLIGVTYACVVMWVGLGVKP